jgi:hypothetical protein
MIRLSTASLHGQSRSPSPAEQTVFDMFAHKAAHVGRSLAQSKRLSLGSGPAVDLTQSEQVELVLLSLRSGAKDHVKRGEDLLTLIERVGAMLNVSPRARGGEGTTDVGLHLMRAIAIAELLQQESTQRFARHEPLRRLAEATMTQVVQGFVARFGGNIASEIQRAFPRFARTIRTVWQPVEAKRRLLPWLIKKA